MIDLFEVARLLSKAGAEFVIVGGIAVRSHGGNYVTDDLDLCYSRTTENLKNWLMHWRRSIQGLEGSMKVYLLFLNGQHCSRALILRSGLPWATSIFSGKLRELGYMLNY